MKIYLASDIHVEFHKTFTTPSQPVDVVVLAGDIHTGANVLKVAAAFHERCQAPVVVILGNHEFYGTDYVRRLATLRTEAADIEGVHLLERDGVVIDGVRFLGCTLWSNFQIHGPRYGEECKRSALLGISDFSSIRFEGRRFTPDHAVSLFQQSYDWLEAQLATAFDGPTVVVTHFLPHWEGVHPIHAKGRDPLTAYFAADCSELMRSYPIDVWMYGHTHNSVDFGLDVGVRLVSNQRGYPNEPLIYTQFNAEKIIEVQHDEKLALGRQLKSEMHLKLKKRILNGAAWLPVDAIAEKSGRKLYVVKEELERWIVQQAIFCITQEHQPLYPEYLLDPHEGSRPYMAAAEIIQTLSPHRTTGWQLAHWFQTANEHLDGSTPKDLLTTEPELVLEAAHRDAEGILNG